MISSDQTALDRLITVLGLEVVADDAASQEQAYQILLDCPKGTVVRE